MGDECGCGAQGLLVCCRPGTWKGEEREGIRMSTTVIHVPLLTTVGTLLSELEYATRCS